MGKRKFSGLLAGLLTVGFLLAGCEVTVTSDTNNTKTQYYYMEVGTISTDAPRITKEDLNTAYPGTYISNNWWFPDTWWENRIEEQLRSQLTSLNFSSSAQNVIISKVKSSGSVLYLYLRQDSYYGYVYIVYE